MDIIIYPSHDEIETIAFWEDETTVGKPTDDGDE